MLLLIHFLSLLLLFVVVFLCGLVFGTCFVMQNLGSFLVLQSSR